MGRLDERLERVDGHGAGIIGASDEGRKRCALDRAREQSIVCREFNLSLIWSGWNASRPFDPRGGDDRGAERRGARVGARLGGAAVR